MCDAQDDEDGNDCGPAADDGMSASGTSCFQLATLRSAIMLRACIILLRHRLLVYTA